MYNQLSSEDLLVLIQKNRSQEAFRAFYKRYEGSVRSFLYTLRIPSSRIEDILRDTMTAVWASESPYKGDSEVATWILGVAKKTSQRALRKASEGVSGVPLDKVLNIPEERNRIKEVNFEKTLRVYLNMLPKEQREAIEAHHLFGHSIQDIADWKGVSPNTIKTRIHYAMRKLKRFAREG